MTTDEQLVEIELNPREKRLYDRVRGAVVDSAPGEGAGLRDMLLLLPDLVVLLTRLLRDSRVPTTAKVVAVLGIGYVLTPIDLMPVLLFGPIGLVDDLFIAAAALSHLLSRVHPDVVRSHWSGPGDVLDVIQRVTSWAESQLSTRVRGALLGILAVGRRKRRR